MCTGTYTATKVNGRDRSLYITPLYDFVKALPNAKARKEFAASCGVSLGRLRNVMYGLSPSNPKLSVLIERNTGGKVTRFHLHPDDGKEIWTDGQGASAVPADATEPV
jgi:DNA-binding transcriptional regulator YdaS (Cro superfamily)